LISKIVEEAGLSDGEHDMVNGKLREAVGDEPNVEK
jgi:hypothetical protein